MLQKHKNAFLDVIQKSGLDPAWFRAYEMKFGDDKAFLARLLSRWTDVLKSPVFTIQIIDSPIKFCVRHTIGTYDIFYYKHTRFTPGFPEEKWSDKPIVINALLKVFDEWLRTDAKEYIENKQLPDLWEHIESYKSFVTNFAMPIGSPSSFTEEEKESLRQSVQEFRRQVIENFKLSNEQEEFINVQLDYLTKAVDRLNRFDWRGLAISTLIGIAINLSVDKETGRLLFRLFQQAFHAAGKLLQ